MMLSETPVITEILDLEVDTGIPLTTNMPKFLSIRTLAGQDQLVLRVSEKIVPELAAKLGRYLQAHGSQ